MKNSQRAGSQDDRAGTGRVRRWWTGEKLSVRLLLVAFVLVLTGALAWAGWFASASQYATWSPVLMTIAAAGAVAPQPVVSDVTIPLTGSAGGGLAAASHRDRAGGGRGGRGRCVRRWFRLPVRTR